MGARTPGDLEPLFPDRDSAEPLVRQVARRLREAIESGLYQPATRLLPQRDLAQRLGLSRNTIATAIQQLVAEGYLEARVGAGTFIAAGVVKPPAAASREPRSLPARAKRFAAAEDRLEGTLGEGPLRGGIPDVAEFPFSAWLRIARRKLTPTYWGYRDAQGDPDLRRAIVQHVQQLRGVSADPDRVIVVEGTQAALRLAADVLLSEGDRVVVEDPCYQFARSGLEAWGMRLIPARVDADGVDVRHAGRASLAYVTPSHQFPLGVRMSRKRRDALLTWAREHDAYVLEDDYDSEFWYDERPLPALQSIDRDERVLYVGSFSKTLAPGLRVGYLIVPRHLAKSFALARVLATLGMNQHVQATLAEFIAAGHYARHVHRMTAAYGERRRALIALLQKPLARAGFTLSAGSGGLNVSLVGPPEFDDVAVAKTLVARGIRLQPLSAFCIERTDCRGFVVGYGAEPLPQVLRAARDVVAAIEQHAGRGTTGAG
ncbi:MAG TPA: PLP-dependent aminotransferase family protein [Candidatus Baltobacteraceae bacterium]|nr:PLP-dependent aminotransferase family protein [Candidatus Baltobacteraceae bacterium]